MRRAAALAALLGAGLLAGHALADSVPVPTVPSITSVTSIVSVTSSLPSVPLPPPPPPPPPVTSTPSLPVTTALTSSHAGTTSTTSSPSSNAAAGSTSTSAGGARAPTQSGGSSAASPTAGPTASVGGPSSDNVTRGHTSRTWISPSGSKRRRTTVLTFALPHRARIFFVVEKLAPACRVVSRFAVTGRAGVNRLRFPRPRSRVKLDAGTYRISGRTKTGRLVERVVVVVFDREPTAAELHAARSANVCASPTNPASSGTAGTAEQAKGALSPTLQPSGNGPTLGPRSLPGGILGSTAAHAARALRPALVALLGLSILLLGIASLPKLAFVDRRGNELLARYRAEIAAFGAAAFVAVLITFLVE